MYLIHEASVIAWTKYNELKFLNCACRFTERVSNLEIDSKRKVIKELIKKLKEDNPNINIDNNIFTSLDNINLNCVLGTKKDKIYHSFLDDYENE